MIENVGNLVCPAAFDLGEDCKVSVLSVTEGEDKPLKYPRMFRASDVLLINKIDLLPHLRFDVELCKEHARRVHPEIRIFEISCYSGDGLEQWYRWLREQAAKKKS
jgi:hydrogenase nickel incorporation protein HypB